MEIAFRSLLIVMGLYERRLIELIGPDDYRSFAQKCEAEGYREVINLIRKGFNDEKK